jgi:gluconate 5-dehydrogenase
MSLAADWGPFGVTVNCLAPGWFKTAQNAALYEDQEWVDYLCERIPLKRPGQPHDLDGAVVFLASAASAYITGQTLLVDGGISTGATRALPKSAIGGENLER